MKLGVAVGQYQRPIAAVQTCVNMFPERSESRALGEVTLRPTPGLTSVTTGLGCSRGALYTFNDVLYAVSGGALYSIDSVGTSTLIGAVNTSDFISIADNGTQMLIVTGGTVRFDEQYFLVSGQNVVAGAIYNGVTLTPIADPDFPTGDLGQKIYFSDLGDGSVWTALDFFSAESNPDALRTHITSHGNLLLFGEAQLEYWTPTGDAALPFQKSQGSEQERGCLAAESVVGLDNTIFFLGDDRVVYKVLDFRPVRVSHHALEATLETVSLADLNAARAFAYTQSGHYFYCLTIADVTWVYDSAVSQMMGASIWHIRSSDSGPWRVQWYAEAYGTKYGLDEVGTLWAIEPQTYTENGAAIPWEMTIGPFTKEAERVTCPRLTLICETGSINDLDVDPQIELDVSRDLGRTWFQKGARSLGMAGDYVHTVSWRRNGDASATPGFTFRFHGERSYEFSIMDAIADIHD
jgi:hypothetical protein